MQRNSSIRLALALAVVAGVSTTMSGSVTTQTFRTGGTVDFGPPTWMGKDKRKAQWKGERNNRRFRK